jgi:hypothetical protein
MASGSACPTKFRLHVAGFGVQGSSASSIQHLASRIRREHQLRSQLIPNYFSLLAVSGSGTVLRGGRYCRRHMRDTRRHHRGLTPKLQDRKDGADGKNSVDQGFESAALLFLRAHEKCIGGFKRFCIRRVCFHGYLSVRCRDPALRIQDFR